MIKYKEKIYLRMDQIQHYCDLELPGLIQKVELEVHQFQASL